MTAPWPKQFRRSQRLIIAIFISTLLVMWYLQNSNPTSKVYNPANTMSQEEIDRIWSQWRRVGKDKVFHSQFAAKENHVARKLRDDIYFGAGPPSLQSSTSIPRYIHQTYKTADRNHIETDRLAYMDTWITMNRGFSYKIWTDSEMITFVKANYPKRVFDAYSRLPMIVQKADFFRYLVLYKLGGYYTDTDTRCARHVNWWRIFHEGSIVEFIAGLEWYMAPPDFPDVPVSITNWAFASAPNHPILNLTIESITRSALDGPEQELYDLTRVVHVTGPMLFTKMIQRFLKENGEGFESLSDGESHFFREGGVLLLSPVSFNPGSFEPDVDKRDERTMLYHEFAGNKGWKKVKLGKKRLSWWPLGWSQIADVGTATG